METLEMTPCYIIFGMLVLFDFEDKSVYLKSLSIFQAVEIAEIIGVFNL